MNDTPATATATVQTEANAAASRAVDVLLAEFTALRAEIVSRTSAQATLVGVGLTALGVIVGFVVKDNGDERLLLALPPLGALVNLLWSIENRRVTLTGAYIREAIWPQLKHHTGVDTSWEQEVQERRASASSAFSVLAEGVLIAVFAGAALAGLIVASDHVEGLAEAGEWVLVGLAAVVPASFALLNRDVHSPQSRLGAQRER